MERMGKNTFYMSDTVYLGSKDNLPPGASCMLMPPREFTPTIELRAEQQDVIDQAKDWTSCLIEARTGAGKTVQALWLCEYWGTPALIVVHTRDMVNQFYSEFVKFFGSQWTDQKVSKYFSGSKKLNTITITTTKSFTQAYKAFAEYGFENLIRDEADLEFSEAQRNAMCDFPAKRKFGFTGTIYKEEFDDYLAYVEGDEPALVRFYGQHIKADDPEVTPLRNILYFQYDKSYEDEFGIPYTPQTDWIKYREQLDNDAVRKKMQASFLSKNIFPEEHCLALFDRVDDVEKFYKAFKDVLGDKGFNINMIHGSVPKKRREKALESFDEKGGLLIGQVKTVGRGFNCPPLSKVFILHPTRSENGLRQIIGRALREHLNKESFIFDWVDSSLQFQFRQRKKVYQEYFNIVPNRLYK